MLRILHFGRFWPDNPGGIERHVDLLLTQLALRGVDCTNLVANEGHERSTVKHQGYTIAKAGSWGVKFRTAMAPDLIRWAVQMHREHPFDAVHAHFPDPLTHLALAVLPANLPKIITWHSDLVPFPALQRFYQPLLNPTLMRADAIVAATPARMPPRPGA